MNGIGVRRGRLLFRRRCGQRRALRFALVHDQRFSFAFDGDHTSFDGTETGVNELIELLGDEHLARGAVRLQSLSTINRIANKRVLASIQAANIGLPQSMDRVLPRAQFRRGFWCGAFSSAILSVPFANLCVTGPGRYIQSRPRTKSRTSTSTDALPYLSDAIINCYSLLN